MKKAKLALTLILPLLLSGCWWMDRVMPPSEGPADTTPNWQGDDETRPMPRPWQDPRGDENRPIPPRW